MLCVYGFGGMREYGGSLSFHPRLPKGLTRVYFPLAVQGRVLEVEIKEETATYRLRAGEPLTFRHGDQEITLSEGGSRSVHIGLQGDAL